MGLPRGRRPQKLLRTGRVLLLTISLGFAMLVIINGPTMPTQVPPRMAKGSPWTNFGGIKVWNQIYGGPADDGGYCVEQTTDGGYIITGSTHSYGADMGDVWLIKTDTEGHTEWTRTYGGSNTDYGRSVEQTTDGGYIITGSTRSYGAGGLDVWLIKTDTEGYTEWNQTYGGPKSERGRSVEQTTDGGYIITGTTANDAWVIKTDANGHVEWNQTYGGPFMELFFWGKQTMEGGYIITGTTQLVRSGNTDVWVIKIDNNGHEEWNQTYGGPKVEYGESVEQTTDGGYIIIGSTYSYGAGEEDVWLIKTDTTGHAEWNQTYGGPAHDVGFLVEQTINGGYILTGYTESYGAGELDVWVINTDANGHMEWNQTYGGPAHDVGFQGKQTTDEGYIIIGSTVSYGPGGLDVWLIKTDANGLIESEIAWGPIILPLTVIGIVLVVGGVFVKRKR